MEGGGPGAAAPILLLTQGHAGDRLGARLAPALRRRFPGRPLVGLGGPRMAESGVRLLARTDGVSAMGYTGLLPELPRILRAVLRVAAATRKELPACVVAVDVWQPLQALHRFAPHLRSVPHVCYLPPAPNFIGAAQVHAAVSRAFAAIVTPFPHQERLLREAGGCVIPGAHAGLEACREEARALPPEAREPVLALLPGSRGLEVRYGLPVQVRAARRIVQEFPGLTPVVCCASEAIARQVRREAPDLACSTETRQVLARARFALICSGTAALEAAVLGCPGVVTYHGSPLQRWEWTRLHAPRLARLRAAGIASPYVALPNILAGEEVYPELLGAPAERIAETAIRALTEQAARRPVVAARGAAALPEAERALRRVAERLFWTDAGEAVARAVETALRGA